MRARYESVQAIERHDRLSKRERGTSDREARSAVTFRTSLCVQARVSKQREKRTAYSHTMADQPDEAMDFTDLPLLSRSNVLTEAQDAAPSTSATPFAEPPTITAPKSQAQKQREYRQRIAVSRTSAQAIAARKSDAERQRNCRLRKAANLVLVSGSLESTTASSSRSRARSKDVQTGTELTHQQRRTSVAETAQITVQDFTDLPLLSRSNVLTEAQDAAPSTSATPSAEPPTIAAPKSQAQKQCEYRQRIAVSRTSAQAIAARKSDAERQRNCRLRKAANLVLVSGSLESTTASSSHSRARSKDVQTGTEPTHQQRRTSVAETAQITVT